VSVGVDHGSARALEEHIAGLDASEQLLLVDPTFYPLDGYTAPLFERLADGAAGVAHHLMVVDATPEGTKEYVQEDSDGRVRRIQRYYYPVTWPFATGVACSVVPVAALLPLTAFPLTSLVDLRRAIGASGSPSQDVPLPRGAIDLRGEDGVLSLVEHLARSAARPGTPPGPATAVGPPAARAAGPRRPGVHSDSARGGGPRTRVAPTARLVGPVLVEDDVHIDEGAVVIGPSLLCAGARVGAGAVVAQCLVMPGVHVPPAESRRHRVVFADAGAATPELGASPVPRAHVSRQGSAVGPAVEVARPIYPEVKAVVERGVALAVLAVLAPLFAAIAFAVKLTSPGPVFFGHLREGRGGRPFRCWKFRTMRVGADAAQRELMAQQQLDGPQFKMAHDPRVTPAGRWLRRANLDELPQLLNVVLGQMSFVGPRPSPFRENQICVPWRQGRLSVRPGITGLWQVCRHDRDQGDFHQWIEYDLLYVHNMSLLVDLKILAATLLTLGGRRAVPVSQIIPERALPRVPRLGRRIPAGRAIRMARQVYARRPSARGTTSGARVPLLLAVATSLLLRPASAQELRPFGDRTASGWQLSTGVAQSWARNLRFAQADGPSDLMTRTRMEGARLWRTPRTRVALAGSGALVRFGQSTDLNRSSYDVGVQASHAVSRRVSGAFDSRAQSDLTSRSITPVGDGPLLAGLVAVRTNTASGTLTSRATRRVSTRVGARFQNVSFNVPTWRMAGPREPGSGSVGATPCPPPSRQTTSSCAAAPRERCSTHTACSAPPSTSSGRTSTRGSRRGLLRPCPRAPPLRSSPGRAGVARAARGRDVSGVGGGQLRYRSRFGDNTLEYQRSVGQVFGREVPAVFTTDLVALTYRRAVTSQIQVDGAARYAWNRGTGGTLGSVAGGDRVQSAEVTGGARYTLPTGLLIALGAFWRQRDDRLTISSRGRDARRRLRVVAVAQRTGAPGGRAMSVGATPMHPAVVTTDAERGEGGRGHPAGRSFDADVTTSVRNAVKLSLSLLATWGIGLVVRILMPRQLGPALYGTFQFADAFTSGLFILVGFGIDTYVRKEVATRREHASTFFGGLLVLQVVLGVVLVIGAVGGLALAGRPPLVLRLVATLALMQIFVVQNTTQTAMLHAVGEVDGLSVLNIGSKLVWGGGVVFGLLTGGGVQAVATAGLVTEVLRLGGLTVLARRHLALRLSVDFRATLAAIAASMPFYLSSLSQALYGRMDVTLLSFLSNDTEVGWYGAAASIAGVSMLLSPIISWVLLPLSARAEARSAHDLAVLTRRSMSLVLAVAIPVTLLLALGADVIVRTLLGPAFGPSVASLRVIAPVFVLTYVGMLSAGTLIGIGRGWAVTAVMLSGLVLSPLLNFALIPYFRTALGAGGAGVGAAAALNVTELYIAVALTSMLGRRAFDRRSLIMLAKTAVISLGIIALDRTLLAPFGIARLAVDLVLYAFFVVAWEAADYKTLLDVVRRLLSRRTSVDARTAH
jgi:lipopolysaccharide/colanic/teichoic acid biosynthesis glycosyltransferase/O-antigen/teichoic acid export membrane protein